MPRNGGFIIAFIWLVSACASERSEDRQATTETDTLAENPAGYPALLNPRSGGFDDMIERRLIRVLVTYNNTHFFLDKGRQRGIVADALVELEKSLNQELGLGARKLHVAAIPVDRDELIPFLERGRGDVAAANLTITPERLERVDFTVPTADGVSEIVVTGPGAPRLRSLDDLSGQQVQVRRSSSFFTNLERLNTSFEERGLERIEIVPANEHLETEDLLEMTAAGLVPITIADAHMARFWSQILDGIVLHEDLAIVTNAQIGWAIRKSATGLKERLDPWIEDNRQGRLLGNMLLKRYLQNTKYVTNALADADRNRLDEMAALFRKYADQYDFDWLLVAAQAYQESALDQSKRSRVGAVGVMQLMPATAADPAVGIPNIEQLEPNIHAGNKYLRYLVDQYFDEPEIDDENRLLFAFAGYNAGPNRIRRLRGVAAEEGFDPNRWFRNVEVVVARDVGREPVHYVANIYKYYVAYSMALDRRAGAAEAGLTR